MLIEYQDLRIRNAGSGDAEMLCKWWNDGSVMAHAGFPNGLNTNAQKIIKELAGDSDDGYRRLIIEHRDIAIGEMSCRNKNEGVAEIGIKICDTQKQEKGLGTILLKMLIGYLFDNGYKKIILDTNVNNTRAQHVYEKIGFKKLCVNENAWRDQLGVMQSSIDYELVREDFAGLGDD